MLVTVKVIFELSLDILTIFKGNSVLKDAILKSEASLGNMYIL